LSSDFQSEIFEKINGLIMWHFNINPYELDIDDYFRCWNSLKWMLKQQNSVNNSETSENKGVSLSK